MQIKELVRSWRVIAALVTKDLVDLLKNRSLLSTIGTVTFLMVLYQVMPMLDRVGGPPLLAVYDPGRSSLVAGLDERDRIVLVSLDTQEQLERYVGKEGSPTLGLTIPADFDGQVGGVATLQLDGIVDHWVGDSDAAELQSLFEAEFSEAAGRPVQIQVERDTVYTVADGWKSFLGSLSLVVLLTILGLLTTPGMMLEEKEAKTINALLVSPAGPAQIVLGKAISGLLLCLVGATIWIALSASLVLHWGILIAAVVLGALFNVALGLALGTILQVKQQVSLWSFVLFQPLLLGPVFAYIDLLPQTIRDVLLWIPSSGLARTLRLCFAADAPLSTVGRDLAVLAGATAVVLVAVVWLVHRADRE